MPMDFLRILQELTGCHGTPGDEGEVAAVLERVWQAAGWTVTRHGRLAVSASPPAAKKSTRGRKPRLLVCAHLDAPGFIVERIGRTRLELIPLGAPHVPGRSAAAVLKTRAGKFPLTLVPARKADPHDRDRYTAKFLHPEKVAHGDRAAYAGALRRHPRTGEIRGPFLDNRLGCAVLAVLAERLRGKTLPVELVLGATACEEMGGFGAPVLARAVQPDLVVCLDATYEAPEQNVRLGGGPVLTLSDASVLLPPAVRDAVREWFAEHGFPLQTEVYNYSGTDSRAFPHQGLPAVVLPLLLATRGNHEPEETASLADADTLVDALCAFAAAPPDLDCRPL